MALAALAFAFAPAYYLVYTAWFRQAVSKISTGYWSHPFPRLIRAFILSYVWIVVGALFAVVPGFCLAGVFHVLLLVLALIALVANVKAWMRLGMERWRYLQIHPQPRFQIWIQDMLVLGFFFGATMLLWRLPDFGVQFQVVMIVLLILSQCSAFLAALDAIRLSPQMTPRRRIGCLALALAIASVLPVFPCMAVSWWAWKRAIWIERLGGIQRTFSFG